MKDRLLLISLSVLLVFKSLYPLENPLPGSEETTDCYLQKEKELFLQENIKTDAGSQEACLKRLVICIEQEAPAFTEEILFTNDGILYLLKSAAYESAAAGLFYRLFSETGRHRNYSLPETAFKWVKFILETVVNKRISGYDNLLEEIYTNGYNTDSSVRLNQIKQICCILHPLFSAQDSRGDNAFENSPVYNRILRREIYLIRRND